MCGFFRGMQQEAWQLAVMATDWATLHSGRTQMTDAELAVHLAQTAVAQAASMCYGPSSVQRMPKRSRYGCIFSERVHWMPLICRQQMSLPCDQPGFMQISQARTAIERLSIDQGKSATCCTVMQLFTACGRCCSAHRGDLQDRRYRRWKGGPRSL